MIIPENIIPILKTLPERPGVYRFLDERGQIIYVGKAKSLKKRVSSYFTKNHDIAKLRVLVSKIRNIEHTVVNSEWEALLLENSMIKQFSPRYNAMLKDDKTYPWLAITREAFPRIFLTRNPHPNRQILFGPYPSIRYINTLLDTLFAIFPVRNCLKMPRNSRPCIQYQIKKCAAPCARLISEEEYQENINGIIDIMKGNNSSVIKWLTNKMMHYAEQLEFEQANEMKIKIDILKGFQGKSVVVNPAITQTDVFTIEEDQESAYINFMRVMEGAVIQSHTVEIVNKWEKNSQELLLMGILEVMEHHGALNSEILLPFIPSLIPEGVSAQVPLRGEKKKLLDLSQKNAYFYKMEKHKRQELVDPEKNSRRILQSLQNSLGMGQLPTRIECFDNSNTQGEEPVAAMVCFINGKPAKKEYRHFNIKTVVGADDFATMEEVVYRRYKRLLDESLPLPELVLIDGGKGQLHAAYNALTELQLTDKIMVIGIAKRLEDIYKVGDSLPLYIDKKSEAQKLLQHIRDEVHRFGIGHHRKRRAKKSMHSELDQIKGIGTVYSQQLLTHFKSVKRIKEAPLEELSRVIGEKRGEIVFRYFKGI
ncbi:MAG: excinuclease ABC subunit UvrC [Bacteroidales bacterium]|jgi:excinuclease ABC subunit C|nr:excinuclease ABC subunit UvrC [Bacteroidales bacterium]